MTPENENPERVITAARRIYSEPFLLRLGERFKFDAMAGNNPGALRLIAQRYLYLVRAQQAEPQEMLSRRKELSALKREIAALIKRLQKHDDDIALWLDMGRLAARAAEDQAATPGISQTSGEAAYRQLIPLLEILERGVALHFKGLAPGSGRKLDYGLDALVRHAAIFWAETLGRKFSVDHHKGGGVTEAFEFVRALAEPLASIPDTAITTAMRREVSNRSRSRNPPGRSPKKPG